MLNGVGSCCGNRDKINSPTPDFLLHTLHTMIHICVGKSLMIWPDVVFAHHESPLHQVVAIDSALGRNSSDYELTFRSFSSSSVTLKVPLTHYPHANTLSIGSHTLHSSSSRAPRLLVVYNLFLNDLIELSC